MIHFDFTESPSPSSPSPPPPPPPRLRPRCPHRCACVAALRGDNGIRVRVSPPGGGITEPIIGALLPTAPPTRTAMTLARAGGNDLSHGNLKVGYLDCPQPTHTAQSTWVYSRWLTQRCYPRTLTVTGRCCDRAVTVL